MAGTLPVFPIPRGVLPGAMGAIGCGGVWVFNGFGIDVGGCVPVEDLACCVGCGACAGGPYGDACGYVGGTTWLWKGLATGWAACTNGGVG